MKGKNCFRQGILVACALSLIITLPACRKLGLDDTPRIMPNGEMPPVGPKRQPIGQHSSINSSAATKSVMQGAVSPSPSSMASIAPATDPYAAAYSGNNFWANGSGWAATPPNNPINAVAPTPQMMPPLAAYQQPQMNPVLSNVQAYMQQSPYAMNANQPPMQMMPQQQNYNAYPAPQFNAVGSFGMQQTPAAPQQAYNNQDFPRLQDTPNSPFYRSQQEIAGDINALQNQSLGYGWQNTPSFPTSPAGNFSQPVALQDNYGGYNPNMGGYADQMQQPPQYNNVNPNSNLAPAPRFGTSPDLFGGNYSSQGYDAAGFVPPAPIAGVADAPVMAQDWDRNAYQQQPQQGGGSAYGMNQPLQLQPPFSGGSDSFLPSSRYQGRDNGSARSSRGAVPATMNYGGY